MTKLLGGQNISDVCKKIATIDVLPGFDNITNIITTIVPMMAQNMKILEPFMDLPGFPNDLRDNVRILLRLVDMSPTNATEYIMNDRVRRSVMMMSSMMSSKETRGTER